MRRMLIWLRWIGIAEGMHKCVLLPCTLPSDALCSGAREECSKCRLGKPMFESCFADLCRFTIWDAQGYAWLAPCPANPDRLLSGMLRVALVWLEQ